MTNVLVVDVHAEMYRDRLPGGIPGPAIRAVPRRGEVTGRPRRHRRDDHVRHRAARRYARACAATEMDPIIGDRRRSFPTLPVAQARRRHHQRPRHPRPADARTSPLHDDGGEPRRQAPGRRLSASHLGAAAVEHAAWQDRGDRRHRNRRRGDRRAAPGAGHACRRRQPHAAPGRRLRRSACRPTVARSRGQGRLSHQCAAGEHEQFTLFDVGRLRAR